MVDEAFITTSIRCSSEDSPFCGKKEKSAKERKDTHDAPRGTERQEKAPK